MKVSSFTKDCYGRELQYKPGCVTPSEENHLNKDDEGLNSLFTEHNLPLKNSDGAFNYDTLLPIADVCYPQAEIVSDDNTVSKLKLGEQEVFNSVPVKIGDSNYFPSVIGERKKFYNIVPYGNSITKGLWSAPISYPSLLKNIFENNDIPTVIANQGFSGAEGSYLDDNYGTLCQPYLSSEDNAINIVVVFEFTNQLNNDGSTTPQEAVTSVLNICDKAQSDGAIVIVLTATSTSDAPLEARIQTANDLLVAQYSTHADYIIDIRDVSELFPYNGTYYFDALHPNDYSYHANIIYNKIIDNISLGESSDVLIKNNDCAYFNGWQIIIDSVVSVGANEVIKFKFKSDNLGIETGEALFSIGDDGTDGLFCLIGTGSGDMPDESIFIYLLIGGVKTLEMYIKNTHVFFKDGNWHDIEIGLNGNNYITYDGKENEALFEYGGATTTFSLNNKKLSIGSRKGMYSASAIGVKGYMSKFEISDFKTNFDNHTGIIEYDNSGNENNATLSDDDGSNYRATQDSILLNCIINGFTIFQKISDSSYLHRQYIDSLPVDDIVGYNRIEDIPANSGFSNTGNTIKNIQFEDWAGVAKTFAEILAIGLIPKADVQLTKGVDCISKMLVQPMEVFKDVDGNDVCVDGELLMVRKY